MIDLNEKDYVIVVQCHIVKERCPGFLCEKAFTDRSGGFTDYPKDRNYRVLNMTCGGCCGLAVHRKLTSLLRTARKKDGIDKDRIVVQLSSCITKDNFHGPVCPHIDYIKDLIGRIGLDLREDTVISPLSEKRRQGGAWSRDNE